MQNASIRLVIIVVIKSQNTELKRKGRIKKERMKKCARERERESECERIARKNMFAYTLYR